MPTRNAVRPIHHAEFMERPVPAGLCQNANEVRREGLRLMESRESEEKARLNALREAARVGIADVEGGRVRDFRSTADLRTHLNSLAHRTLARVCGK